MLDIEDFTTDALRREILRREEADRNGQCWYCDQNLAAHTCKLASPTPTPGWLVQPPRFVRSDSGCMGELEEYWQVEARNPTTGRCASGTGVTGDEALTKCIENIGRRR